MRPYWKIANTSSCGSDPPWPGPLIWPALLGHCSWLPTRRQPQQALAVQASPGTCSPQLLFLRSMICSLPQGGKLNSGEQDLNLVQFPPCRKTLTDSLMEDLHLDHLWSLPSILPVTHYTVVVHVHRKSRVHKWNSIKNARVEGCCVPMSSFYGVFHSSAISEIMTSKKLMHGRRGSFSILNDYTYKFCKIQNSMFLMK
jgi:hypothetical protein